MNSCKKRQTDCLDTNQLLVFRTGLSLAVAFAFAFASENEDIGRGHFAEFTCHGAQ